MFVLCTGGRTFTDQKRVDLILGHLFIDYPKSCVVQGGARGLDRLVHHYCVTRGKPCVTMDAPWEYFNNQAGTIRNQWMLDFFNPAMVLHFPGGTGTADMVARAKLQGFKTYAC
jgi:hypothetical protein